MDDATEKMLDTEETRKEKRDNDRIFNGRVSILRRFIAKIHIRNQPGDDLNERDRLSFLQNLYGMNQQDLVNLIYTRGRDIMEREAVETLEMTKFQKAVLTAHVGSTDRRIKFAQFDVLYKSLPPEMFESLCSHEQYYEDFLTQNAWQRDQISMSKKRIMWLRDFLHERGRNGECKADVIKIAAEGDKIIFDDNGWKAMKTLASRYKLSNGRRGYWKWSPRAQMMFQEIELVV